MIYTAEVNCYVNVTQLGFHAPGLLARGRGYCPTSNVFRRHEKGGYPALDHSLKDTLSVLGVEELQMDQPCARTLISRFCKSKIE